MMQGIIILTYFEIFDYRGNQKLKAFIFIPILHKYAVHFVSWQKTLQHSHIVFSFWLNRDNLVLDFIHRFL